MNKNEFFHALCDKLKEGLTAAQIEEHVQYYNDYINQEEATGKSEAEVIESLGDPTLLARTILESPQAEKRSEVYQESSEDNTYQEETQGQARAPFQMGVSSGWGCLAVAVVAMLVIGVVLWLMGAVFKAFMPVIMPVLAVLFVVALFKQRR